MCNLDLFYWMKDMFHLTQDLFYLTKDLRDWITDLNCLIYQEYTSCLLRPDYQHLYPQHPLPPLQLWSDESNIWVGYRYCSKPPPEYQTHVQQCLCKPKIKLLRNRFRNWLGSISTEYRREIGLTRTDLHKLEINAWSREIYKTKVLTSNLVKPHFETCIEYNEIH